MNKTKYYKEKIWLLFFLLFAICTAMVFSKAVPQNINYHKFADARTIATIPNFWNVLSNVPFLIIGIAGIYFLLRNKNYLKLSSLGINYIIFFIGIFFIGIGSGNYHLQPNNDSIVWDRIPMTIAFMSFFSIIIGEFIHQQNGKILLFPLIVLGITSVYYWHYTENISSGDLRFYFIVQFFPMFLIPLILILFKQKSQHHLFIWLVLLSYFFAKLFETYDFETYNYIVISGHTIKHFFAALGPSLFLYSIWKRLKSLQ